MAAVAAALVLPLTVEDGSPFPARDLIVFVTLCVVAITLTIQELGNPHLECSGLVFGSPFARN